MIIMFFPRAWKHYCSSLEVEHRWALEERLEMYLFGRRLASKTSENVDQETTDEFPETHNVTAIKDFYIHNVT